MASKPPKRAQLQRLVDEAGWSFVGEAEWESLRLSLAPITDRNLRQLLRDMRVELSPLVEGVRLKSLDELDRTLLGLAGEYMDAPPERRKRIRRLVIEAKNTARFLKRRADRDELVLRLLTWLENPPVFPAWLAVRAARANPNAAAEPSASPGSRQSDPS